MSGGLDADSGADAGADADADWDANASSQGMHPAPNAFAPAMRWLALSCLVAAAALPACNAPASAGTLDAGRLAATSVAASSPARARAQFAQRLAALAADRARLAQAYLRASSKRQRSRVLEQARQRVVDALIDDVLPAWLGTPWDFNGTAAEPGRGPVACGYFVSAALANAGLNLSRVRFGQSAALVIQRALEPRGEQLHRYFSIPPAELERRLGKLSDGLYVIGLDIHVGFVTIRRGSVRLVHASYTDKRRVTNERLATAKAIANSQPKGYFVSPVFQDDRLVIAWLKGSRVRLLP